MDQLDKCLILLAGRGGFSARELDVAGVRGRGALGAGTRRVPARRAHHPRRAGAHARRPPAPARARRAAHAHRRYGHLITAHLQFNISANSLVLRAVVLLTVPRITPRLLYTHHRDQ
jgi:hypothetical protein